MADEMCLPLALNVTTKPTTKLDDPDGTGVRLSSCANLAKSESLVKAQRKETKRRRNQRPMGIPFSCKPPHTRFPRFTPIRHTILTRMVTTHRLHPNHTLSPPREQIPTIFEGCRRMYLNPRPRRMAVNTCTRTRTRRLHHIRIKPPRTVLLLVHCPMPMGPPNPVLSRMVNSRFIRSTLPYKHIELHHLLTLTPHNLTDKRQFIGLAKPILIHRSLMSRTARKVKDILVLLLNQVSPTNRATGMEHLTPPNCLLCKPIALRQPSWPLPRHPPPRCLYR